MSRWPDVELSGCCQAIPAKHPQEAAFAGAWLDSKAFATAYARFMSTAEKGAPLHGSNCLPGPGNVLAFKTAALAIAVHLA